MARKPRAPVVVADEPEFDPSESVVAAPKRPHLAALASLTENSASFRPAREELRRVIAVPTIFPQVDHATRVGGWPTQRVGVVHGESGHGKTAFCNGVGLSFLKRGHLYALVDAEMTTPITWLEQMFGAYADDPAFIALRPKSYEQTVDAVRGIAENLTKLRHAKKVPAETSCLFVIDSIRKLVPEDIQERIRKMGAEGEKGSVDGFSGAAGRMRAALNAAWLDELVPLMYRTGCAIIFIARESEDPTATARDKQFGSDWKMTGGKSLEFDSSIIARIGRAGYLYNGTKDEKGEMVGERHLVEIRKTKVAAKQDRVAKAYFHTSNGRESSVGFDVARDLLELGTRVGVVKWGAVGSGFWASVSRAKREPSNDSARSPNCSPPSTWRSGRSSNP